MTMIRIMGKRLLWVVTILVPIAVAVGFYMYLHQPKSLKPAPAFTGHFTEADVSKLEQQMGETKWVQLNGTIDPLKINDGMKFTLIGTTDNAYQSHLGQQYTLQITVVTRNGVYYPILFSMNPGQKSSKPLLGVNSLSGIGWLQYFEKNGIPGNTVEHALQQSGKYLFQCQSGTERGKTLVVTNFQQWNEIMGQKNTQV